MREFSEPLRGGLRAECRSLLVPLTGLHYIGHDADSAELLNEKRVIRCSQH